MENTSNTLKSDYMKNMDISKKFIDPDMAVKRIKKRRLHNKMAQGVFSIIILFIMFILGLLLYETISTSIGWLDWGFLTGRLSINPVRAGIKSVIIGTGMLMVVVAPVTLIIGVATAIYLEEYSKKEYFTDSSVSIYPTLLVCHLLYLVFLD